MKDRTKIKVLSILVVALFTWSIIEGISNFTNDNSDIKLFKEAVKVNEIEAFNCAELQWEDKDLSRECLMNLIKSRN